MKKRVTLCLIGIVGAMFTIFIASNTEDSKQTFMEDGVMLAVNVDGTNQNSFPLKGMYKVSVICNGAEGKWDYDNWKLNIDSIEDNISCDLTFNSLSKVYLNKKITSLSGTTQGNGQVVNENGYRYEGKNPDNYIWFNNELWRIIGVFDESSHGQVGKNLVKIIRANPIGGFAWDKTASNNWSTSSLKSLLNGAYYNKQDGTESGYCCGYSTTITTNCDYSNIGIDSRYREMVVNATWFLGASGNQTITTDTMYNYERDETRKYVGNPASETGYIGLMYASDYGYASLASSCARTTHIGSYDTATCAGENWLYEADEWIITPDSARATQSWYIENNGRGNSSFPSSGKIVRPVLYLEDSVYVMDGDGTELNPYIIEM